MNKTRCTVCGHQLVGMPDSAWCNQCMRYETAPLGDAHGDLRIEKNLIVYRWAIIEAAKAGDSTPMSGRT